MAKKQSLNIKNFILAYFALIFIFLLIDAWPSFFLPPLSDDWHMFYFIHHLGQLPGNFKWLHILNYDPFEQMRFQPLSRMFYYLLHLLFGTNFIFFKLFNLILYFTTAIFVYVFSLFFIKNKITAALGTGLFVFLSNHFDIMLWAHHIYIIFGLLVFILGFISHIRFISGGRKLFIYLAGLCFLAGLCCYEPFFFWPFAVFILCGIKRFQNQEKPVSRRASWAMLGAVYAIYVALYLFTRSLGTYARPSYGLHDFLKPVNFISSVFLTLFNFVYNGILVNIWPTLAYPLTVTENVYMGGRLLKYIDSGHEAVVYVAGALTGLVLTGFYAYLRKKKYSEEIRILSFFFFLMFSVMYTLFFCRLVTNSFIYGMTEFRYQYAQNAVIVLIAVFIVDRFIRLSPKIKWLLGSVIAAILILNIYCARQEIKINNEQLADLKTMLSNISNGMRQGYIDQQHKLYLENDIPDYLPSLCWNIEMGSRFIQGTYQWMFSAKQVKYFADNLEEASWAIDKDDFSVIPKEKMHAPLRKRVPLGKEDQYSNLANYYREHRKFKEAEEAFNAAVRVDPDNYDAYNHQGDCYRDQGKTEESNTMYYQAGVIQTSLSRKK
jgi:Tetratricopeptide repeat